ncbi:MAG: hypothetical protein HZC38_04610 [Chloroflexi bacterium]|nr:hypothetical protein [Chloroflexota bacterium]MBI5081866.1 hypothetical protein [Chloroflexota bacterium]MBI5712692.1 hypothetical protein [Chloroflexota bacterium]
MSQVATQINSSRDALSYHGWGLWWRWVVAMTLGELVGFTVPSIVGGVAAGLKIEGVAFVICVVIGGMGEGAVLGFAQWLALRLAVPKIHWREWVLPTTLAAGVAWIIGMVPGTFVDFEKTDRTILIVGGILLGILFVLSMGGAQWFALRHYVPRAWWWIAANAIAWPVGVMMPFVTLGIIPDDSSVPVMIVAGVIGGVLMGIVVGAITGAAFVHLTQTKNQ